MSEIKKKKKKEGYSNFYIIDIKRNLRTLFSFSLCFPLYSLFLLRNTAYIVLNVQIVLFIISYHNFCLNGRRKPTTKARLPAKIRHQGWHTLHHKERMRKEIKNT